MADRKHSIQTKLLLGISLICTIVLCIIGLIVGIVVKKYFTQQLVKEAKDMATAAAAAVTVDTNVLKGISEGMEETDDYKMFVEKMRNLLVSDTMKYIYIIKKEDDGKLYFWADADEEEPASIGEECDACDQMFVAFSGTPAADTIVNTDDWGSFLSGYAPVFDENKQVIAIVGIDCDVADIQSYMKDINQMLIIVIIIGILINIIVSAILIGGITSNIRKIVKKVDDVVHNDGDLTKKIIMKSHDETKVIANLLNEFISIFRNIISELNTSAKQVRSSSSQVVTKMAEFDASMNQTAEHIQDMNALMEETTASMEEITSSVTQVNEQATEVSSYARDGIELALDVKDKADELQKEVTRKQTHSKEIADRITNIVEQKIEESKKVSEIAVLTDSIIGISNKSKILALNASVEAARAGQAGKSFAIVAEEITNMSNDTKKAAIQISSVSESVIMAVSELSKASLELINFIVKDVKEDYDLFVSSSDVYKEDAQQIYNTMEKFTQLSQILQENVNSIQNSIVSVESGVETSTANIGDVVELIEKLRVGLSEIYESSVKNDASLKGIEQSVKQFKI